MLFLLYVGTYLTWSRLAAWRSGDLWCFYQPPYGLVSLDLINRYQSTGTTAEQGWEQRERLPGTLFRPCICIDEVFTGQRYLPTYDGVVCFN